jgi:hypothetical protein
MRRALGAAGLVPLSVTSANVQPHEILARFRRTPPQQTSMERTMELRERVEASPFLAAAKATVNACLSATGAGDTLRALAEKR